MIATVDSSVVDTDVHDAFSFLDSVFVHESEVVDTRGRELVCVEPTPPPQKSRRSWTDRLAGVFGAVKAALAVVRDGVAWLTSGVSANAKRRAYTGRHQRTTTKHRIQRTPLGRDRSTSEYAQVVQRRCREAATSEECDLRFQPGDTFVDWLTVAHDSLRYVNYARKHLPEHGRWVCS